MYRIYENGTYRNMTAEEIEKIKKEPENIVQELTLEEQVKQLQENNQMLTNCLLEISEIIYQ